MMNSTIDTLPMENEESLIERLKASDELAYEQLVRECAPKMLSIARRFLKREEDAQEAVQDAFTSAFRAMRRFSGGSRLSTWLHRITVNAALMKLRASRSNGRLPIDDLLPSFSDDGRLLDSGYHSTAPPDVLEREELRSTVRSLIEKLPENYHIVLVLRDIEERDTSEVAEILQITPNAVKVRLHRARQALKTLVETHLQVQDSQGGAKAFFPFEMAAWS